MTKNELFDIITKKSSTYCNEKVFKSHFPHFYNEISALSFPADFKFSQKLYHYFHNDYDLVLGICTCGNRCHYKNFTEGYRTFCSLKCRSADENQKNKREKIKAKMQKFRQVPEDKGGLLRAFIQKEYARKRYEE